MAQRVKRMVEQVVEDADGIARHVQVNLAESPLGWLKARGLVTRRQYERGNGSAATGSVPEWARA